MPDPDFVLDDAARHRLEDRFGDLAPPWFEALPGLIADCCRRWGLTLDSAQSGGTSRVFAGRDGIGRPVFLKLTPDPAIAAGEAAALRAWAATPHAVTLLAADPASGALLLAAVQPGTRVSTWPRLPPAASLGRLLAALRDAVPPPQLPPLADRVDFMFSLAERRRRGSPAADQIAPHLIERGRLAALALAAGGRSAVVHGDLHPGNVLDGGPDRGLVAIDPRPAAGDPDFDVIDWAMTGVLTEAAARARIAALAPLVPALHPDRCWAWCTATAVLTAIGRLRAGAPDPAAGFLLSLAARP